LMTHFYFFSFSLGSSHSRQTLFEIVSPCALISFRRDSLSSFAYVRGLPLMSFAVCVFLLLSFRVRRAISEQIEHTRTHCKLAGADGGRREELADDESSSIEKALSDWMVIERNGRLFSTTCYYTVVFVITIPHDGTSRVSVRSLGREYFRATACTRRIQSPLPSTIQYLHVCDGNLEPDQVLW
jgi:hypothetical protein